MTENEVQQQTSTVSNQPEEGDEVVSYGMVGDLQEQNPEISEQPSTEESNTQQAENQPDTQQEVEQPTQEAQEISAPEPEGQQQSFSWNDVFKTVKDRTGIQFDDVENLVNDVSAYHKIKDDPYADLPTEIKAHIDFINSGGDTSEYYRLKSMDFEKMSDKEVLFQNYLRDNPDLASNMDFARMDFSRNFNLNYNILNGPEKRPEDFMNEDDEIDRNAYDQYKQDFDYLSQKIKIESGIARKKLIDWQQKTTSPKVEKSTGLTDEQANAYLEEHKRQISQIKENFKGESFTLSDKAEDKMNLGLSDSIRSVWENDLENPMNLFSELGLMPDGRLDMEKFKSAAFKFRIWPQLGPIISKFVLEQNNKQTVLGKQVNPVVTNNNAEPTRLSGDDEEAEAAQLFFEQNMARMRGGRR